MVGSFSSAAIIFAQKVLTSKVELHLWSLACCFIFSPQNNLVNSEILK
jgi:hypothetical protein